jgi:hypothetical protein
MVKIQLQYKKRGRKQFEAIGYRIIAIQVENRLRSCGKKAYVQVTVLMTMSTCVVESNTNYALVALGMTRIWPMAGGTGPSTPGASGCDTLSPDQ